MLFRYFNLLGERTLINIPISLLLKESQVRGRLRWKRKPISEYGEADLVVFDKPCSVTRGVWLVKHVYENEGTVDLVLYGMEIVT